ncbi:MAG: SDR family NAD(P)-dependent oxidoreductase [Paracoccaceae bacterium]
MRIELNGKTALVTGGNRGIGLATVNALAETGAQVTFTGRSDRTVAEGLSGLSGVEGVVCDSTDRDGMAELLARGFDILINNAGIITPIGRLDEVAIYDWARNIEVNLVSAFFVVQQAAIVMQKSGGGTIINLSSGAAHNAMEGWSAFCAGKAGLAMVTKSIHKEMGGKGIRIFGFAPGIVDTKMQGSIRASGINPVSQLRREDLAPAHEPAQAMAWLCTPAAAYLAGQELDIRQEELRRACGLEAVA